MLVWRGAASAALFSTADWAYMKAPVPCPTLRLVDKVSRSCGYTPGKVTGQRATVKAEMNGLTPALTATRRPAEWVNKATNPSKCLAAPVLILERFSPKIEMGGKAILGLSRLDYLLAKTGGTVFAIL